MSEPTLPHPPVPQSTRTAGFYRESDGRWHRTVGLHFPKTPLAVRLFQEFQWRSKTLLRIGRIAIAHMRLLLSENEFFVDYGLSFERNEDGGRVRRKRTQARMNGTDSLLRKYPWASVIEEDIFLLGFDRGEEFAQSSLGKSESQASALSYCHEAEAANDGYIYAWKKRDGER